MPTRYQLSSNLSEPQIEADVSNYFGWISPNTKALPFRLIDTNEGLTGADKFFDCAIPIYIQFKVSQGLKSIDIIPASNRRRRSKLEDIREFRHNQNIEDNPTLYFKLRDIANHAEDYQHNILLKFANTGHSNAFYVAPLTLDKTEYFQNLFNSKERYLIDPFLYRNIGILQKDWISYLGFVPFLREHISIVPHERVNNCNHYYSFSQTGTDIAWHSPQFLGRSVSRLSDVLMEIFNSSIENADNWLSFAGILNQLRLNLGDIDLNTKIEPDIKNFIHIHTDYLYQTYAIKQFLILGNRQLILSNSQTDSY